jgi:hypothetical protein
MVVVSLQPAHRAWAARCVSEHFWSTRVVSRGRLHDTSLLPGLVAVLDDEPAGVLWYRIDGDQCEVVAIVAERPRYGAGTALLDAVHVFACAARCRRLWLVTTNDNLSAQAFYRAQGWRRSTVYPGAVRAARALKPEIPACGENGTPIEDEIEYELPIAAIGARRAEEHAMTRESLRGESSAITVTPANTPHSDTPACTRSRRRSWPVPPR